jgi:hypothetical protein
MTSSLSFPPSGARRSARRKSSAAPREDRTRTRRRPARKSGEGGRLLARYSDHSGRAREVVAQQGSAGSVLVVDRTLIACDDRRLVAHLTAEEPRANASLECERYLKDARRGRCRPLTAEDFHASPFADEQQAEDSPDLIGTAGGLVDQHGRCYRLELAQSAMSIPELRWLPHAHDGSAAGSRPVSVRDAIAQLEAYEPVRAITQRALALHRADAGVSTTALRAELQRVLLSPIVLNRELRRSVLATVQERQLSMSEIATRCGRVKRDQRGNESGETSWLARRLGILPEGGRDTPTPWIHSDVLALIARRGLGISPREVEVQ